MPEARFVQGRFLAMMRTANALWRTGSVVGGGRRYREDDAS